MGLSLTWPILSFIQEFCADRTLRNIKIAASGNRVKNCVSICGDDLIAAWTIRHSEEYFNALASVGLKRNTNKEFRSSQGGVFVEKAFGVRTVSKQVTNHLLKELSSPQPTLWDFVKVKLPLKENQKAHQQTIIYKKITYVTRPLLSAITLAKAFARAGNVRPNSQQQDAPAFLTLGPCLTTEWSQCTEPWRKAAVLTIARRIHAKVWKAMENSGVPLHYPRSLGGWGIPGKPEAPRRFRKAAAVILLGQRQLQDKLQAVFLCSKAPPYLRKKIKKGLDTIQSWPERFNPSAVVRDLEEATKDYTARLLAFHGRDPKKSKLQNIRYANIGTIAKRINNIIDTAVLKWKSVNPMVAGKAIELDLTYRTRKVDCQYMTLLLARRGVYDSAVRDLLTGEEQSKFLPGVQLSNPEDETRDGGPLPKGSWPTPARRMDVVRNQHFLEFTSLRLGLSQANSTEGRSNYAWRSSLTGDARDRLRRYGLQLNSWVEEAKQQKRVTATNLSKKFSEDSEFDASSWTRFSNSRWLARTVGTLTDVIPELQGQMFEDMLIQYLLT